MNSNRFKEQQLGLKLGTAQHRLRKMIMFDLAKRLGLTDCYRCGSEIKTVDEFSIDHKDDWLHVSVDLFWNLSNIAFSHGSCNYAAHRPNLDRSAMRLKLLKDGPAGTLWCSRHKDFLPEDLFTKNASRRTGKSDLCRDCRSQYRSKR